MNTRMLTDYAAYLAVRTLVCLLQALPMTAIERLSSALAALCWHGLKLRRKVLAENLQIAFPEKSAAEHEQIALAMWRHLFLMVAEIAHAPRKLHRTNWQSHSSISRMDEIVAMLVSERPTVIISGHLGNFELGGYLLALHGFKTHTIARPLDNPYLNRYVNQFREATGQYMLPKTGSGLQIAELLENGGTLVLLGDQFAGKGGCWVDFFGKPASTHKAVAVFTLGSLAPTAVCASLRRARPLEVRMEIAAITDPQAEGFELGTVPLLTQWYTDNLEMMVRNTPQQYWWVHRRWKDSPPERRRKRGQSVAA